MCFLLLYFVNNALSNLEKALSKRFFQVFYIITYKLICKPIKLSPKISLIPIIIIIIICDLQTHQIAAQSSFRLDSRHRWFLWVPIGLYSFIPKILVTQNNYSVPYL